LELTVPNQSFQRHFDGLSQTMFPVLRKWNIALANLSSTVAVTTLWGAARNSTQFRIRN